MTAIGRSRIGTLAALAGAVTVVLLVASFAAERLIAPPRSTRLPDLLEVSRFAPSLSAPGAPALALAPVPPALLRALAPNTALPEPAASVDAPAVKPSPARRRRTLPDSLPPAPPLEPIEEDLWQP